MINHRVSGYARSIIVSPIDGTIKLIIAPTPPMIIIGETVQRTIALINGLNGLTLPKVKNMIGAAKICAEIDVDKLSLIIAGTKCINLLTFASNKIIDNVVLNDKIKPMSVNQSGVRKSIMKAVMKRILIVFTTLPINCAEKAKNDIIAALTIGASKPAM